MSPPTLPSVQRAAQIRTFGEPLAILTDHPVPDQTQLKPNECLVKIEYAGLCQTDLHIRNGDFGGTLPRIGGHEGVGTIVAIGSGTADGPVSLGDRVGLKWMAQACLHCDNCLRGNESTCSTRLHHGYSTDGTFAKYAIGWTNHVTPIPKSLDSAAAASILCGGLTVYKAIKRIQGSVPTGSWIAIAGAGGGLGHLAIQYAILMGFRVIAIDCGEEKRQLCLSLGAEKWVDFKESGDVLVQDVVAAADGIGPQVALVTAGVATACEQACYYVRPTGSVVCVGLLAPTPFQVPFQVLVGKELNVFGSLVGNRQEAIEAMQLAARGKVKCQYTVRDLVDVETVFEEMGRGAIAGKVVPKVVLKV